MAETLTFFVRGVPSAGGSKKAFVHPKTKKVVVVDDAKRNMPWREVVASVAREHFAGPPLDGPSPSSSSVPGATSAAAGAPSG
jgi:hypothetical protein